MNDSQTPSPSPTPTPTPTPPPLPWWAQFALQEAAGAMRMLATLSKTHGMQSAFGIIRLIRDECNAILGDTQTV